MSNGPEQLTLWHVVQCRPDSDMAGLCRECGINTMTLGEFYMVHDSVWPLEKDAGLLCIGCLEERIGRRLVPSDFTACPLNRDRQSPRLRSRYGEVRDGQRVGFLELLPPATVPMRPPKTPW
jgi:hypothetical protein